MPVDIYQPKTWVRYKPSNCTKCMAGCCSLPLKVDSEDLYHMGFLKMEEVNGPLKRIANRLIKQGIIRSYSDRTGLFLVQRHKNNDCIFLGANRLCTIYDRRPYVCRSYPKYSVREGYCPYKKKRSTRGSAVEAQG